MSHRKGGNQGHSLASSFAELWVICVKNNWQTIGTPLQLICSMKCITWLSQIKLILIVRESLLRLFIYFSSENDRKETQKIQFIEKSRAEKFCK
jgi:hypothetical protein